MACWFHCGSRQIALSADRRIARTVARAWNRLPIGQTHALGYVDADKDHRGLAATATSDGTVRAINDASADVIPPDIATQPTVLNTVGRIRALRESGLSDAADEKMEYFARRVRDRLGVPIALVMLVESGRQVFPGMIGLPEPCATSRATPLSQSFCQHVVATGAPLIVTDARADPLTRDTPALSDLGVVAYAGMPLTDEDGHVLGTLCAVDDQPHSWTEHELTVLGGLAQSCSTELRLRLLHRQVERERARADHLHAEVETALARSQLLLAASEAFTNTRSLADIRARVSDLISSELAPVYVGMLLTSQTGTALEQVVEPGADHQWTQLPFDAPAVAALAARERRIVHYPDRATYDHDVAPELQPAYRDLGLHALTCVPMLSGADVLGVLAIGWDRPRQLEVAERAVFATIAGYAARALERARVLQDRIAVAARLQQAMLTDLPDVPGLEMAARYVPADAEERVGGDWFDVVSLPPSPRRPDPAIAITVGDVAGHDMDAAARMGQLSSMLRQAVWDAPSDSPSAAVTALERASVGLGRDTVCTLIHARMTRLLDGTDQWSLSWTNAGHPPPLVATPDRGVLMIEEHDLLFGYGPTDEPRHDQRLVLTPGTTVLLYTDGLIERRDRDIDQGIEQLRHTLAATADRPPHEIVDRVLNELTGGRSQDDVVVLAIRVG